MAMTLNYRKCNKGLFSWSDRADFKKFPEVHKQFPQWTSEVLTYCMCSTINCIAAWEWETCEKKSWFA